MNMKYGDGKGHSNEKSLSDTLEEHKNKAIMAAATNLLD